MQHILPEGWRIKNGFLECPKENYSKHVLFSTGKLDRELIAIVLENWGHEDIAKRWNLTTAEANGPELLEALKAITKLIDGSQPKDYPGALFVARRAIQKAEG